MKDIKNYYYPNKYKQNLVRLYNRDMYPPPPSVLWRTLKLHIHLYIFTMEIDFDTPYPPLLKVDL